MTDENLNNGAETQQTASTQETQGESLATTSNSDYSEGLSSSRQEKMLSQSQVNDLIHAERRRAYEKGLQESASRQEQKQVPSEQTSSNGEPSSFLDESKLDALLNERFEKIQREKSEQAEFQRQQAEANRVYSELGSKLEKARQADPSIDEKLGAFNYFDDMPGVQFAANQFDNSAEILAYLASNPREVPAINSLATMRDRYGNYNAKPAIDELRRISDRLKQNEIAKNSPVPPSPISQIETTVRDGVSSSGDRSVNDFKRMFKR